MFEGAPADSSLQSPLEGAQVVGEVIRSSRFTLKLHFVAGRISFTQISVEYITREISVGHDGEVGTEIESQTRIGLPGGQYGNGKIGSTEFGLYHSGPVAFHALSSVADNFHAVVLGTCFRFHAFVLHSKSENDSPFLFFSEPFDDISFDGEIDIGRIAVQCTYLLGEWQRGGPADVETGFDFIFQTVERRLYDATVTVFLCLQMAGCCQHKAHGEPQNMTAMFHRNSIFDDFFILHN